MTKETLRAYLPMKQELAQIEELIQEVEQGKHDPKKAKLLQTLECLDEDGDIVAVYQRKKKELQDRLLEIEAAIDTLPPTQRTIIRWHFIEGLTWRQVAERENYCERHVKRMCDKALARLREV